MILSNPWKINSTFVFNLVFSSINRERNRLLLVDSVLYIKWPFLNVYFETDVTFVDKAEPFGLQLLQESWLNAKNTSADLSPTELRKPIKGIFGRTKKRPPYLRWLRSFIYRAYVGPNNHTNLGDSQVIVWTIRLSVLNVQRFWSFGVLRDCTFAQFTGLPNFHTIFIVYKQPSFRNDGSLYFIPPFQGFWNRPRWSSLNCSSVNWPNKFALK